MFRRTASTGSRYRHSSALASFYTMRNYARIPEGYGLDAVIMCTPK